MSTILVTYYLSQKGQKAALLAGQNAADTQQVTVEAAAELLALDSVTVSSDGKATARIPTWFASVSGPCRHGEVWSRAFDAPLTPEEAASTLLGEKAWAEEQSKPLMEERQRNVEARAAEEHRRAAAWLEVLADDCKLLPEVAAVAAEVETPTMDAHATIRLVDAAKLAVVTHVKDREARELADWISTYGSDRLRLCARLRIEYGAILRDERHAWATAQMMREVGDYYEDHGWTRNLESLLPDEQGVDEVCDPRNPPMEALEALRDARYMREEIALRYVLPFRREADTEEDDAESEKPAGIYVLAYSSKLGTIYRAAKPLPPKE
jgi:hypothetical protein